MKKLLLLLCTLLGTASAWATDVTVIQSTSVATTYGSLSGTTFTTNSASGMAGVTVDGIIGTTGTNFAYGACLALTSTASGTITMTAPDGYIITGYTLTARSNTWAVPYTLTPAAGGNAVETNTSGVQLTASSLGVQSTSFTYSAASANSFYIPSLVINVVSASAQMVNVTYQLYESDGTTLVNSTSSVQEANSAINVPSSWTSSPLYSYDIEGSIGNTDCTIKVTRTLIGVLTTANLSNSKCYTIRTKDRGWWVVPAGGTQATSTTKASLATAETDLKQQFAFISYENNFYLYSVSEKKFISKSGNYTTLTATPGDNVTLLASSGNSDYPTVVAFRDGANHAGISNGYTPAVITHYNSLTDDGNRAAIIEAADFDATEALAALENYFHPSATAKYVISDASGVIYTSEFLPATVGDVISTLPSDIQRAYCTYVVTNTTIAAGENTVPVTVTYSFPFALSANFDEATWYYATIRNSKYLRADDNNKDGSGRYTTNSTNEKTDVYKWAFFGNPYGGLYIMNKGQGNGKYLYAGSQPAMQTVTDPTQDDNALWAVSVNDNGFSVRSITGANLYINDAGGAGNLGYWNSTAGATDGGSRWIVSEVPAATVDVTYELWVGGTKVNTVVDEQVAANSDVAVPASLTAGYSTLAYDFVTSGTIGDSNCTITVTGTMKSGVITALSQLSNTKAYTLSSARGSLGSNGTQMVSTFGTSYTASNFAIISYEDNFYLYSVADSKFIANTAQPALTEDLSTIAALVFDDANATAASPLFFMGMGSNGVNVSNYETGIVVNDWTTRDAGNQYCIIEAADFDATNALAALEEYFHPAAEAQFNDAIAALEAINFGTGLNQYGFTGDYAGYTSQAAAIINGLKTQGYSETNLTVAQTLLANYALNMPTAGFYRIKGKTSSTYLAAGSASNGKYAMTDATDLTTIFYFDGTRLVNASSGFYNGVTASSWAWVDADGASTVEFQDGLTNGGYGIKTATANFYDNGNNGSADRGGNVTITTSTNARYTNWYMEEVSLLEISLNNGGDGNYYATFCAPFAATVTGASAYTMAIDGEYLVPTEVSVVEAGTPVLLKGDGATATLAIGADYAAAPVATTALTGTFVATTITADDFVLGKSGDVVGFYQWDSTALAANRAYLKAEAGSSVKGFAINWAGDIDAIRAINASESENGAIYNLAGQRVSKATRGIYIKNGKKVVVK